MTGWAAMLVLAAAVSAGLWRAGRLDRAGLQFTAAALLLAMAGYALQGRPELSGAPAAAPVEQELPESEFAKSREAMLGSFDTASRWLIIAEGYQRRGDTESAAGAIRAGLKAHPRDADLWVGLGSALIGHGGGLMSPAARLAFERAERLAPDHPGPKFFYALGLAQSGRFDEAEAIWRAMLTNAPADAGWRAQIEERVRAIEQARAMAP